MKGQIAKRPFLEEVELSILGFGGMVLVGMSQGKANAIVREALGYGINYFDVAPFYGDGEAETKMGEALISCRDRVFLACKTLQRTAEGARMELELSLRRLRTGCFDLYQYHAVSSLQEVEQIFSAGGAAETFLQARREGKIRFIGFSAHSVEAALALLERYSFDSILFPVNFICFARGNFGPQVINRARERGAARLALKTMALGPRRKGEQHGFPNCWYRPIEERALARMALRFTLSQDVTAAIPPGDERLFRMAMEISDDLPPLDAKERLKLLEAARGKRPLFRV
jgi:aryl-alcohol dehydrogenase-like predicted oxidoreductase